MIEEQNMIEEIQQKFNAKVHEYISGNDPSYLDAILSACEELELEPELGAKLISKPMREKLELEAAKLNMIPKKSKLPI